MPANGLPKRFSRRAALRGGAALLGTAVASRYLPGDVGAEGFARLEPDARKLRYHSNPVNQGANSTWDGPNNLIITSRTCPPNQSHWSVSGRVQLFNRATGELVVERETFTTGADDYRIRVTFEGLDPQTKYVYKISGDEFSNIAIDGTTHSSLLRPGKNLYTGRNEIVRLVFVSCMEFTTGWWDSLSFALSLNPDAVHIIGDSIYADVEQTIFSGKRARNDPMPVADGYELYLAKYLSCNDADRIKLLLSGPGYFLLDDHELLNNVQGANTSHAERVAAGFKAYTQVYASPNGAETRGLYRRVDYGQGTRVLLLDGRIQRNASTGTMLGQQQLRWLLSELAAAKTDASRLLIVTPSPFVSGLNRIEDTWAGFVRERQIIIDEIAHLGLSNVTFISGDLHTFYSGNIHLDPFNLQTEVVANEFVVGAVSSSVRRTGRVNPNVLASSVEQHGILSVDVYPDGSMETSWWLNDAKARGNIPVKAAQFYSKPQTRYGEPHLGLEQVMPEMVTNHGEIPLRVMAR